MNDEPETRMPTHPCPVCGKKIPINQDCCPECEFLFYSLTGLL